MVQDPPRSRIHPGPESKASWRSHLGIIQGEAGCHVLHVNSPWCPVEPAAQRRTRRRLHHVKEGREAGGGVGRQQATQSPG